MSVLILLFGDILFLYFALFTGLFVRYYPSAMNQGLIDDHIAPFTLIFAIWIFLFGAFGLYDRRFLKNEKVFLNRFIRAIIAGAIIAIMIFYLTPLFNIEPRRNLLIIVGFSSLLIFLWRFAFNHIILRARSTRVLFMGFNKDTIDLADYLLKNPQLGQRPIGFIQQETSLPMDIHPLPIFLLDTLPYVVQDTRAETIVTTREARESEQIVKKLFEVIPLGVGVVEFSAFHEMLTGKIPLSLIKEIWFLENLIGKSKPAYEIKRRSIDIVLALLIGVLMFMLLPFVVSAIILSTPSDILHYKKRRARTGDGIIFFQQQRVGKNGKPFNFIKFRSQVLGAERMSEAKELQNDPRQYMIGRLMRTFYLDELPQIWNVLKGEMSFVGPRPERPEYVEKLKQHVPFYEMRLLVPPGITGWAQIHMENDASVEDAPEKMQYDLYYIKNRALTLDLLIMLRTLFTIIQRQGR